MTTYFVVMKESLGGIDIWDPAKYLNIFIADRVDCTLGEVVPGRCNKEQVME